MYDFRDFYVDGRWIRPAEARSYPVIRPSDEAEVGRISLGSDSDVERAVRAARAAFPAWSQSSREQRLELLEKMLEIWQRRADEIGRAITDEMGAPDWLARGAQYGCGVGHLQAGIAALRDFAFEETLGSTRVLREPIGVCALITPWNWPVNQVACKVVPALATGCTMVLKPSEIAPLSAYIWAQVMDEAGVPAGVFNLVNGDGAGVGAPLTVHPEVDMVSFTGSTRAGIEIARGAAESVKRVCQELGGKSPNVILPDADLESAVSAGVAECFHNSGQSCNAPTRMLVPRRDYGRAVEIAVAAAREQRVGDPQDPATRVGPLVSEAHWQRVQRLIQVGIDEGAEAVCGGTGRPDGLKRGYYARPTVFADVDNDMRIAREEVFGPVLVMIPYDGVDDAVAIANDTPYGLAAYVQGEPEHARTVARRLRAGMVHINGADTAFDAPFGGYKQSGNGREWGVWGFHDFLEIKAVMGYESA